MCVCVCVCVCAATCHGVCVCVSYSHSICELKCSMMFADFYLGLRSERWHYGGHTSDYPFGIMRHSY